MEYMPLLLRQFLGSSAPDLPANEFKAYMLALAHIYEDEGPVSDRTMARHLTGKGWGTVKPKLMERGLLFATPEGYMNATALHLLHDYHQQQAAAQESGRLGGLTRAARQRQQARKQAAVSDLFANGTGRARTDEKANNINGSGQGPLNHRAGAHASKRDASATHSQRIQNASQMGRGHSANLSNEFNGGAQGCLKEEEVEREEERNPLCPPSLFDDETNGIELVEGTVEGDEFAVPRRRAGKPIPSDWTPEAAQLSENVANIVAEWPGGEFEREGVKFVEDAHGNDRRHVNWDRAFGVWLTKHDSYLHGRNRRHERPSGWTKA